MVDDRVPDRALKLQASDSIEAMAAKVAVKAGRRLHRTDDPELVKLIPYPGRDTSDIGPAGG